MSTSSLPGIRLRQGPYAPQCKEWHSTAESRSSRSALCSPTIRRSRSSAGLLGCANNALTQYQLSSPRFSKQSSRLQMTSLRAMGLSLGSQVKENGVEPPSYGPCRALKCHDAARALRKRRRYETERGEPRLEARAGAWNIIWPHLCESALYLRVSRRNIP
jgi:hypothetical protein